VRECERENERERKGERERERERESERESEREGTRKRARQREERAKVPYPPQSADSATQTSRRQHKHVGMLVSCVTSRMNMATKKSSTMTCKNWLY